MLYIVADSETVGLHKPPPPASGVVQLAWASIDPVTLEYDKIENVLVNPGCPIDPDATKVHGITDEMVVNAQPLSAFGTEEPVVFIAHNTAFDLRFLSSCFPNMTGSICTLKMARHYIKDTENHKLQTLADALGLERGAAHDAGGDVLTCISLLRYMVRETGADLETHTERGRKPKVYSTMPFGKHKGERITKVPVEYMKYMLTLDLDPDLRKTLDMQIKFRG